LRGFSYQSKLHVDFETGRVEVMLFEGISMCFYTLVFKALLLLSARAKKKCNLDLNKKKEQQ
jgi:hypothetical protein